MGEQRNDCHCASNTAHFISRAVATTAIMVQMYTIAGKQVGSHVLALITLGTTFATAGFFMRGSPADKAKGPPIGASSKEEESFVKYVLMSATTETNWDANHSDLGTSSQR